MIYARRISVLIPYRIRDGVVEVFLQKRSPHQRAGGKFAFFGGHLSPEEKPEDGMIREIREELTLDVTSLPYQWLGEFSFEREEEQRNKYVWYLKTEPDFDSKIVVTEGESGQWFSQTDLSQSENLLSHDREVLQIFFERII